MTISNLKSKNPNLTKSDRQSGNLLKAVKQVPGHLLKNGGITMESSKKFRNKQFPLATVGALAVNSKGQVLIVKTTKWRGTWGVPGGKVEWGETLEEALLREFREEVGLELTQVRFGLLQEAVLDPQFFEDAHFVMVNYYAFSAKETIVPNEEIVEWAWVTPQEAMSYPLNSYTRVLIEDYMEKENITERQEKNV